MKPSLLILAAGSGARYGGLKQLDALGPNGETIMDYSISDALKAGFGKVVLVIRKEFQEDFEKKIAARWTEKTKIEFVFQELNPVFEGFTVVQRQKPWGPAHALLCAKSRIIEPFAIVNADDFYGQDAFIQMEEFLREKCNPRHYAMMGYVLRNTLSEHGSVSRGICEADEHGFLKSIQETKVLYRENEKVAGWFNGEKIILKPESLVSMNCWGFHPDFFHEAEKIFIDFVRLHSNNMNAEMVIPDVVDILVKSGSVRAVVLPCNEKWFGVTHPQDRESTIEKLSQIGKA